MPREVLLIEPNYKNKYPPMGLMKLSTYFKQRGDHVRFYKGDLHKFTANLLCEELVRLLFGVSPNMKWRRFIPTLTTYIRYGKNSDIPEDEIRTNKATREDSDMLIDMIREYRLKYRSKDFFTNPRFDVVCVTTLFTFEWSITIDTINYVKQLCRDQSKVFVGGIASSIIPEEILRETGVRPVFGILDTPGIIDSDSDVIIDKLPLDYSILHEIDYKYPTTDAYFAYMTRGCPNKCKFCAVPKLEPKYNNHVPLQKQIEEAQDRYGEMRNLILLDNNVLGSEKFEDIIQEIIDCGFGRGKMYLPPNPYEIAYRNLVERVNDRAYIREIVKLYDMLLAKCNNPQICKNTEIRDELYRRIIEAECDQEHTATREAIIGLHDFIQPLFKKFAYHPVNRQKIVDFNQGIDARLVTPEKMRLLAKLNVRPVRIAFDSWKEHKIYRNAIEISAKAGLTELSNYMLYNFEDEPIDLYRRLKLSVDLCDELGVTIYSFPMKYHPIDDPKWFRNRDYIGKKWCRKYIRAVQAVLTSTHGKIGRGKQFFEAAFGADENEFHEIMMMPEALIIRRFEHDQAKRIRFGISSSGGKCDNITDQWREAFFALTPEQRAIADPIIKKNSFTEKDIAVDDPAIHKVLRFYQIQRPEH